MFRVGVALAGGVLSSAGCAPVEREFCDAEPAGYFIRDNLEYLDTWADSHRECVSDADCEEVSCRPAAGCASFYISATSEADFDAVCASLDQETPCELRLESICEGGIWPTFTGCVDGRCE